MKILILGKGYVGNYIAASDTKHDIVHIGKTDLDYSKPEIFKPYLKGSKFDWIVNCSGYTGRPNVDSCEDDKENCYHYNVTVPLYITRVANELKIPIIHIGSGCIYSGYDKKYTETDLSDFGADSFDSSFYSKTKDAFEKLSSTLDRYIFRIRIPFNGIVEPKNYLYKLLHYDNLISMQNSVTNVDDLVKFTFKFIDKKPALGIYNVTNTGSIEARSIVSMMRDNNLENSKWKFIDIEDAEFRVARSNCILNTDKIKKLGLELPNVNDSIIASIEEYKKNGCR
jgi:dTDP-4-dehydrorhamnose reductase